jgi:hypothetical protein
MFSEFKCLCNSDTIEITFWDHKLFGYTQEEAAGKPLAVTGMIVTEFDCKYIS